jgi:GrpB-like predicted nucleotidyltransferase (UPF0157 family)
MRTHKKERDEYGKIKKVLAQKFPYDIDGYCDGKEKFVREIEKLALIKNYLLECAHSAQTKEGTA